MSGEDPDTEDEALAASALQHFRDKNPTKVLDCLSQLKSKESDPKILHNIAITEYYMNGTSDPQKLLEELARVRTLVIENAASEQAESGEAQEEGVPPSEDIDTALLQYNQAVILYQTRKYASALEILTRLFKTIEPIEDYLAVRICFLLVDLHILLQQTEKGFGVIAYLEKLFANLNKPTEERPVQDRDEKEKEKDKSIGESLFQRPEPILPSTYSYDSPTKVLNLSPLELDFSIHMYKSKLHLLRPSTDLDLAKEEIKLAMAAGAKVHPLTAAMCVFMKAHQEYLRQNYKKAITLMQACAQKGGPAAGTTAPNNGCFGYDIQFEGPISSFPSLPSPPASNDNNDANDNSNGNHQSSTGNNAAALAPLFFNNLGCIHYKLKKFSAASFYLNRALKDSESLYSPSSTSSNEEAKRGSVDQFGRDKRIEMMYNLGVQMLLTGKPELAFQAFQEVAMMYYKSPQVWLRLAESCVASHVLKLREEAKNSQKSPLVWKVVGGNGAPRHILLPTTGGPHRGLQIKDVETSASGEEAEEPPTTSATMRMGTMSLEYAAKCLRNCLFLLRAAALPTHPPDPSNPASSSSSTSTSSEANNRPPTPPSPTLLVTSPPASPSSSSSSAANGTPVPTVNLGMNNDMRQAALANLSFVSLALANPVVALTSAQELLSLPTHTEVYKYLAHVYAAESLCMLGRASEAIDHLSPSIIDDLIPTTNSAASPLQGTHSSPYSSLTSHSQALSAVARNMLYTNLAAAHVLRDDLPQAQACITQALTHQPSSTKALLLQVYLELRKGNNDIALELLKRGRPFPKRKTKR